MSYFLRKRIFAFFFISVLLFFSINNMLENGDEIVEEAQEQYAEMRISPSDMEEEMLEDILYKRNLVETYGMTQKLLLKKEFNDYEFIKDKNGFLHYATFYREDEKDIFEYALRVKRLKEYVEAYGTKVLFVIAPSKYDKSTSKFEIGMPVNDPDADVNELVSGVTSVSVFDMVDSLVIGNSKVALTKLHQLEETEEIPQLFAMIIRQFRLLVQTRSILDKRGNSQVVQKELGQIPFVADKLVRQASAFTAEKLKTIYTQLLEFDYQFKTSGNDPEAALDLFILDVAQLLKKR